MNRKDKIFIVSFFMVIVALSIIASLNLNAIHNFIKNNIERYGYPAVFVSNVLVEIVDQPIGPEFPPSIARLYGLNELFVFLLAVAGTWSMDIINYNIGRRFLSDKIKRSCKTKSYFNYCKFFYKYGPVALITVAILPLPYVFFVWLSGAFHMRFRTFFLAGMLARAFKIGFVVWVVAMIVH
jgi:membrane protein YqaA with SNARE-associated domain